MADEERSRGQQRAWSAKTITFGGVAIVLVWFALINRDSVRVSWIFGNSEVPLIWVIVFSALAGALIGWIVSLIRRGRDRD